jgi:serine-type D-Ala-D-Ala carboxypeptidase/endopeptidase (penicillin-binding protein 4)
VRVTRRRLVPALLLLGSLGCLAAALRMDASAAAGAGEGPDQGRVTTPLLSARRIPTVVAEPVATQRLEADLADWVSTSPEASCLVVVGEDGERFADHRADVPHVPASAQKLLVAAAAVLELGADHRYRTTVSTRDELVDGVLEGNLFVVGGGDPLLVSADYLARFPHRVQVYTDLGLLADALVDAGLRRVEGDVVAVEDRYDRERYVPGWPERYIDGNVIGPLSALSVNDGFAEYPTTPAAGDLVPAEDPATQAGEVLIRLLDDRGVEVDGDSRTGRLPRRVEELAAIESPPLLEIIGQLLRESDNNTGELLLKEIGLAHSDEGSTAAGAAAVPSVLADELGDPEGTVVADGSGLSLDNRVSCDLLVELLEHPELGPVMIDGLAVAGESGTLQHRFGGELVGRLRAKTGSLNSVTALTGVMDDDGRLLFSYMANVDPSASIGTATVALQDGLAEMLLAWPRTPDVAVLGPQPPEVPDPVG